MIFSLGDRRIVTKGDYWIAPNAVAIGSVVLENNASLWFGAVVRGDTYHFEVVSNESARGILDVQLKTGVPIANAILTVDTEEQGHRRMAEKGRDAARAAIEMANLLKRLWDGRLPQDRTRIHPAGRLRLAGGGRRRHPDRRQPQG